MKGYKMKEYCYKKIVHENINNLINLGLLSQKDCYADDLFDFQYTVENLVEKHCVNNTVLKKIKNIDYETECNKYELHYECCYSCWANFLRTDWSE